MKAAAHFFLFLFLFLSLSFRFTPFASAQQVYDPYASLNTNPDVPKNLHTLTQGVVMGLGSSLVCMLVGVDPVSPNGKCLTIDPKTKKMGYVEGTQTGGAVGFMGSMLTALYTPPIHTADYTRYLAQNFGIAKTAYAAPPVTGTGFNSISPLTKLWVVFRDITYLLFLIVFTIIGIAIMLRIKIDPRTVMSIENQIPKLIIGIILVTLSFPIAGFMIDLMWVLTYLVIATLGHLIQSTQPVNIYDNPMGVIGSVHLEVAGFGKEVPGLLAIILNGAGMVKDIIFGDGTTSLDTALKTGTPGNPIASLIDIILLPLTVPAGLVCGLKELPFGIGLIFNNDPVNTMCKITHNPIQWVFSILGAIIAFIVIGGMLLFALFRLWISLIKAYIGILLDIIFAPFWIIAGALPGSPLGFGAWLKSLLGNLLVFPATIGMFMIGIILMQSFTTGTSKVFVPPLLGITGDPGILGTLIGIGIILLTSQITNIIKDALKSPSLKYTSAIGQSGGATVGAIKNIGGTIGAGVVKTPEMGKAGGWSGVMRRLGGF